MKSLERYLCRLAKREKGVVFLEDALLSNQFKPYALYRLRYFLFRYISESILHGIKFIIIYSVFSSRTFVYIILIHAVATLITSFWWGSLEVMRGRLRQLWRRARPDLIREEINRWLSLASLLSILFFLSAIGWILWDLGYRRQTFSVLHLYLFSILFRFSLELLTLTFHSGIYAIRRIYRPLTPIVAIELMSFLGILGLWHWLGPWGFPVAMLFSTAASTAILIHYTSRLYRFYDFFPLAFPSPKFFGLPRWSTLREFSGAGAAYALMKMDSLLVFALFSPLTQDIQQVELFILFFSISPTIQAGFDWAQLFYFDLKRLEVKSFSNLKWQYDEFLSRLPWMMGILFWGFACVFGTLINHRSLGHAYWLLGPFFISRSTLALAQIRAFTDKRYAELLGSGVLLLLCILVLRTWIDHDPYRLALLAIAAFLAVGLLTGRRAYSKAPAGRQGILSPTEWLRELKEVNETVRIRSVRFDKGLSIRGRERIQLWAKENQWRQRRVADHISRRIKAWGAVTIMGPDRVLWYEKASAAIRTQRDWLFPLGGGLLDSVECSGFKQNGLAALQAGQAFNILGDRIPQKGFIPGKNICMREVRQFFLKMFPEGVIYAPGEPIPAFLARLSSKEKRMILLEAAHFARELRHRMSRFRFDVSALCIGTELKFIFLIDRKTDLRLRSRWSRWIGNRNLEAALKSVV